MKIAVAASILSLFCCVQTRAADTVVQNRDEPARNPYQQEVDTSCNSYVCSCVFPQVPNGVRLTVEMATMLILFPNYAVPMVQLSPGETYQYGKIGNNSPIILLPASYLGNFPAGAYVYIVNQPLKAYAFGKDEPQIYVQNVNGNGVPSYMTCTLTGYTVTVP